MSQLTEEQGPLETWVRSILSGELDTRPIEKVRATDEGAARPAAEPPGERAGRGGRGRPPAGAPPVARVAAVQAPVGRVPLPPPRYERHIRTGVITAVAGSLALGLGVAGWPEDGPAGVDAARSERVEPLSVSGAEGPVATPVPARPPLPQVVDGRMLAGQALAMAGPPPAPAVPVAFGKRAPVGGWRVGATVPHLSDGLMAVPALRNGNSRIVQTTVTLVNDTGIPQTARSWVLEATAGGRPAEVVLWPAAGFGGVPDRMLAPGESVRFLVAVRIPDERTRVELHAIQGTAARAAMGGTV